MSYASMAGGMEVFVDGAGFDFLANLNTVLFESETTTCLTLAGTPLDRKCLIATTLHMLFVSISDCRILFIINPDSDYLVNNEFIIF